MNLGLSLFYKQNQYGHPINLINLQDFLYQINYNKQFNHIKKKKFNKIDLKFNYKLIINIMVEKDINLGDITPIIPNELFKAINLEMQSIIENICCVIFKIIILFQ